jgi:PAS domain S-box-containing protein
LGITADVTEARSVQRAREMTELRFRAIFDSGFQFQLLLDRDGAVLEVNRIALEEGGASGETVLGRPVWDTLWWTNNTAAQERLRGAVAGALGGSPKRYEDEVETAGGALTILEIAVKPFLDVVGQPTQLLLEARDITARRRAEAALQEVDTLTTMGRVAARVAHEINNPLAGIQNSFLLIKGAVPTTHPHFAYVGAIEREIGRIAAVTRQLYETYRPEQDHTGETSVRTILGDAVAFLEQVNRASRVNVEIEFQQVPSVIPLPSAMLRQIAYNLVQNAIEASPSGTSVQICATVDDGHLMLRVRDHGPGVPPELRERIFEPFFSTKDKRIRTSGMGLGLALVRRTVTAAGGDITVVDAEGGGSEFLVTLPLNALETGVSA